MKIIMALVLMAIGISSAGAAEYKTITACWQPPTIREDGSALALSEIIEYQIWYNEDNHGLNWELAWTVPNSVTCVAYTPQGVGGEVCFNGYTVAVSNVDPTKPLKSSLSNEQCIIPVESSLESNPTSQIFMELTH